MENLSYNPALSELLFLSNIYRKKHHFELASMMLTEAITSLPSENLDLALCFFNLAEVYNDQGKYRAAQPLYKRAVAIWEKLNPTDSLSILWFSDSLHRLQELSERVSAELPDQRSVG